MPRDLLVGNGRLLVAFDAQYRLADLYYPHVGLENHVGERFRFGVWTDDAVTWIEDDRWQRTLTYLRETIVTDVRCHSDALGLRLRCNDAVDSERDVYIRKIVIKNLREEARRIKLFFHHGLDLYGSPAGATAMFDPDSRSIIHYKSKRYFLINVAVDANIGIDEYACGRSGIGGSEGTWRDAEDGVLSMNAIQQGAVDSTIGVPVDLDAHGSATVYYWMCAGKRYGDVRDLDRYVLHQYTPDGALAPSWSPWVRNGVKQLPIQEDETALVVWLLARHYDRTRDLEFVRASYKRLVVQPADFMVAYRDEVTHLPLPSFDIWEERQGVFTFTASAVCAGLEAAATLVNLFNEKDRYAKYTRAAAEIRDAMVRHLWLDDENRFARGLLVDNDHLKIDRTIDASVFATFFFGAFPAESALVEETMRAVREKLWVQTEIGGVARYESDAYQKSAESGAVPGNPWLICTLWLAEHAIARATSVAELQSALDLVRWARSKARPSLVLPEQVHPYSGAALSAAPFTWSHAQVISVGRGYLDAPRCLRRDGGTTAAREAARKLRAHVVYKHGAVL